MLKWAALVCLLALAQAEQPAAPSFSLGAGSVPQLVMQQEVMRRVADIYLGFSAATHFQMMAHSELQSFQASDAGNRGRWPDHLEFSSTWDSSDWTTTSSDEDSSDSDATSSDSWFSDSSPTSSSDWLTATSTSSSSSDDDAFSTSDFTTTDTESSDSDRPVASSFRRRVAGGIPFTFRRKGQHTTDFTTSESSESESMELGTTFKRPGPSRRFPSTFRRQPTPGRIGAGSSPLRSLPRAIQRQSAGSNRIAHITDFTDESSTITVSSVGSFTSSEDFDSSLSGSESSDSDVGAFIELESTRTSRPVGHRQAARNHAQAARNLEFMPFFNQQQQQQQQQVPDKSFDELQHQGALEKVHALKFLQMQIALAASDVDKAYWMNKLLAAYLPPQLMTWKVYKNYVSTLALSFMIQLHDSFTQEAFQDNFNDKYGSTVGGSSYLTEALAEHKTYATWFYLSVLKFQLFYVNMYEHAYSGGSVGSSFSAPHATSNNNNNAASFLETELKATPSFSLNNPQGLMMQYAYVSYFSYMLKFYGVFLEMMLSQQGMFMGQAKAHSFLMQRNDISEDDEQAAQMMVQAHKIDSESLPQAFSSWAMVNQWRFMFDFYLLYLDIQMPAMFAAHSAGQIEDAVQATNFAQTDAKLTQ